MPERRKNKAIVLSVPINLRQFYQSISARNFFSTMDINFKASHDRLELPELIQLVDQTFKDNLTPEAIDHKLARYMTWQDNPLARLLPLPVKDLTLKIASKIKDYKVTSSISNIGKLSCAPEFASYIKQFSLCVHSKRPQITLCSFQDRLVISFTSPFEETDIQRNFFHFLASKGLEIDLATNL